MRYVSSLLLRGVCLTIVLAVCFTIASAVAGPRDVSTTADRASAAGALLVVCLLETVVLSYLVLRSRWAGWRLAAVVFVALFGVATFMSLIEAAVFVTRMPAGTLPRLFAMGALTAALFSPAAVLVLGRWRPAPDDERAATIPVTGRDHARRLAVIAAAYVVLYFGFGYFIAWRQPAVREYYGGVDEGGFFVHMAAVMRSTPWLIPFQMLRALLWTMIALPVVRMLRGNRAELALAIALLFSVVMNAQLLLPNPYMPEAVRMTHLLETASSNFVFGFLVGWLLAPVRSGDRERVASVAERA